MEIIDKFIVRENKITTPADDIATFNHTSGIYICSYAQGVHYSKIQLVYYLDNHKHGVENGYWNGGQIQYQNNISHGKFHGICRAWYKNGNRWVESHYLNGAYHGVFREWYNSDKLHFEINYSHGKKHGTRYEWNSTGYPVRKDNYSHDMLHGRSYTYHYNGYPSTVIEYTNGLKHGLELHWDADKKLELKIIWVTGIIKKRYAISVFNFE